ncbi:polyamine aminopropyltransferase [Natronospora cellulosivora (SeqCode)]
MEITKVEQAKKVFPFLSCAFVVSIASIVYELLIGGISSYLLGNSVYQFSITIGLFMTAMGLGSYLSKYIQDNLMEKFMFIEIFLALIGGSAGFILFYSYAVLSIYVPIMFLLIISIGTLTGFELPLLTRIIKKYGDLKDVLANATAADYLGGLIGSVLFPIILLPRVGFITTSYIVGILNIFVAAFIFIKFQASLKKNHLIILLILLVFLILFIGILLVEDTEIYLERKLYRDPVVFSQQSNYQRIVITKNKDDVRFFLDGNIQFSSRDEFRYHESLVHPAMSLLKDAKNILVLGGGDGLAIREILKYEEVENIDLVDLDKQVTDLAQTSQYFLKYNENALSDGRVSIINKDAYLFLENSKKKYDIVIVDLPDPNNESLNKLYTVTFYRKIYNSLNEKGVMVAQSTSPYFAPSCFWIIHNTIEKAGFSTSPYHVNVPSFGDWGFNIGTKGFSFNADIINIDIDTKFLSTEKAQSLFVFGKDILNQKDDRVNTLIRPILVEAYYKNWTDY